MSKKSHDNFQTSLQKDTEYIKGSKDILVLADKTRNIYRMDKAQYERLLQENITRHYKYAEEDVHDSINQRRKLSPTSSISLIGSI